MTISAHPCALTGAPSRGRRWRTGKAGSAAPWDKTGLAENGVFPALNNLTELNLYAE